MTQRYELHVISNTHWDREWLYDFQETRMLLVEMMDRLLDILEKEPRYASFLLDSQVVPLEDYLEVRPENRERIAAQVRAGRLLVGPWYTCPEEFCVNGESLVRNLLFGHRLASQFGPVMKVGYSPFSYGQTSQMPQVYRGFGIDTILFYHGITPDESRSEFIFEGPDGSTLLASRMGSFARYNFYFQVYRPTVYGKSIEQREYRWTDGGLPFHLCDQENRRSHHFLVDPPRGLDEEKLQAGLDNLKRMELEQCTTPYLAYMMGHDSSEADPLEVDIVEKGKSMVGDDVLLHSSLPAWIGKVKEAAQGLTVLKGERRTPRLLGTRVHLFGDVTSTRTRMKKLNSQAEQGLQRLAEPFAAFAWMLGGEYPKSLLDVAWKYLLQCHAHDSIAGSGVDEIERDVCCRLRQVRNISQGVMRRAMQNIQARIDNSDAKPADVLLTAFNPSARPRSEIITAFVDLPREAAADHISLVDADSGREAAIQESSREDRMAVARHLGDATMALEASTVELHFAAEEVPAIGYRTYRIKPGSECAPAHSMVTGERTMENEHLAVGINDDGTLRIKHKATGHEFDGIHYLEDGGEAGHAWRHIPPANDRIVTTRGAKARVELEAQGPLLARYKIAWSLMMPAALDEAGSDYVRRLDGDGDQAGRAAQERPLDVISLATLRRGSRCVEIATSFDNRCDSHRLRALFPTHLAADVSCAETAFDVVERQIDRGPDSPWRDTWNPTHPMHRFVDVSDGSVGLAVLNEGLREYEVTDSPDRTIAITLVRAFEVALTTVSWRWERHPEMRLSQCQGEHAFRYWIYPHAGTWEAAQVLQEAERLNVPMQIAQVGPHGGDLPKKMGLLDLQPDPLALSAVKQAEDGSGLVVRAFNPTGQSMKGRLTLFKPIAKAWLLNLNEEKEKPLEAAGRSVSFDAAPKKIATLLVELQR